MQGTDGRSHDWAQARSIGGSAKLGDVSKLLVQTTKASSGGLLYRDVSGTWEHDSVCRWVWRKLGFGSVFCRMASW
jgi:hypothetical protein